MSKCEIFLSPDRGRSGYEIIEQQRKEIQSLGVNNNWKSETTEELKIVKEKYSNLETLYHMYFYFRLLKNFLL